MIKIVKNEAVVKLRAKRRQQLLCIACGKTLNRDGTLCIECNNAHNNYVRESRAWYQEHKICPRCNKEKLYNDEKVCLICSANAYLTTMRCRKNVGKEHYNKIHSEWSRKEYDKRINQGVCTRCGKRKADKDYKTCALCRDKNRKYRRKNNKTINRNERYLQGLCYFCNNPIEPGYKVCSKHHNQNIQHANSLKAKQVRAELVSKKILY